jgi:hypothetical protein
MSRTPKRIVLTLTREAEDVGMYDTILQIYSFFKTNLSNPFLLQLFHIHSYQTRSTSQITI